MATEDTAFSTTDDDTRFGPFSRRRFLQATAGATALATVAAPVASAAPRTETSLSFTAATGGSATLAPAGDRLVAEIQNVLWSVPRGGGTAVALTSPGLEPTRPQFSPDGSRLVVCAYRGGGFHLWTLRPDGTALRQLTDGPWDDRGPTWSPDGTRIAFASERGGDTVTGAPYRIWVVDVRTGALTRLTGRPGGQGPGQDTAWEDFDPTWSPDGERVLFVRATVPAPGTLRAATVASVAADGSGPVTLEHTDNSGAQLMTPAVSPAGRLAYLRTTAAPAASCTLVVDGAPVAVKGDVLPAPPRWTDGERLLLNIDGHFRLVDPNAPDDGEEIPFTATLPVNRPDHRSKAYAFTSAGTGVRPVRALHLPALSPDGRSVAFAALNALWTADTLGGRPPRKVLQVPSTRYVVAPTWTSDGTALVYADDRDGLYTVRRRDLDSGAETVLAGGGRVFPALSPDGTRLACLDMSGNLVVRDLPDGAERVLAAALGAGGLPGRPSWSPDGRYVALCDRNRLNQRFREGYNLIRVVDTTTGTAALHAVAPHTSLADRYDSGPVWSPDGRWMAVVVESALWLLPVRPDGTPDGEPRRLTTEAADHPSWSADARTLLYLSAGTLRLIDIADGSTRTVRVPLDYRRPRPADTVVHAGRFWDGTGPDVREDIDVVVRGGRIAEVAPHRAGRPAVRRVDASDRTVIPGLWDAHTHPWQSTYGGRQTALQVAYGITTAVSLGGFAYEQARIREAVAAGALAGPRLLSTGELLDGSRVAYSMARAHRTPEGLRRSLARAKALEWDFVKTYVRAPGWMMKEAADFAHERLGVRSGSHLCSPGVQLGPGSDAPSAGHPTAGVRARDHGDGTRPPGRRGDLHPHRLPPRRHPVHGASPARRRPRARGRPARDHAHAAVGHRARPATGRAPAHRRPTGDSGPGIGRLPADPRGGRPGRARYGPAARPGGPAPAPVPARTAPRRPVTGTGAAHRHRAARAGLRRRRRPGHAGGGQARRPDRRGRRPVHRLRHPDPHRGGPARRHPVRAGGPGRRLRVRHHARPRPTAVGVGRGLAGGEPPHATGGLLLSRERGLTAEMTRLAAAVRSTAG